MTLSFAIYPVVLICPPYKLFCPAHVLAEYSNVLITEDSGGYGLHDK